MVGGFMRTREMSDVEEDFSQPSKIWELSAEKINKLDPYRDDPPMGSSSNVEPCGDGISEPEERRVDEKGLTSDFCRCRKCSWMPTEKERVCCTAKRFLIKMPDHKCVTQHEDFPMIINKVTLNT